MIAASRRGAVRVCSGRSWADLGEAQAVTLRAGAAPAAARPMLVAPAWSTILPPGASVGPIAVADAARARVGAAWAPVTGAARYEVTVARDPACAEIVGRIDLPAEARWFSSAPLPVGTYYAQVRAIDADGLVGDTATPRRLRVVAVELPRGAVIAPGRRLVAPEGSHPRLSDPAGLEVAIDRGGFSRAGAELPSAGAPATVRLRMHGDPSSETRFALESRALHADVRMSPRLPRWPVDPIDITVEISDPTGLFDPAAFAPHLTVLVGIDEARVTWREDPPSAGGARIFRTRLAPRRVHGPTVVRVVVDDEAGGLLGRSFVEVASR